MVRICAEMAGKVVQVCVKERDEVEEDQVRAGGGRGVRVRQSR